MLFGLFVLFIGVCFSRSATVGRNEKLNYDMNEVKASLLRDGGVYRGEVQGSCSIAGYTNTSTSITGPTWSPNLLIVSQVVVPKSFSVTSVGFYITATNTNFNVGLVDIVIYNSTFNGLPGTLAAKIPQVNLSTFSNGTFSCIPLPYINTASNGKYWIGFFGQSGYGSSVISRATTNNGLNYYYQYINSSPTVGSSFPNGYNSDPNQLVMGVNFAQMICSQLSCSDCTANSNSCAWCLSSSSCIFNFQTPNCGSWTRNPAVCPACGYNTCNQCVGSSNCAWCLTNGQPSGCVLRANDGNCTTAITEPAFCGI